MGLLRSAMGTALALTALFPTTVHADFLTGTGDLEALLSGIVIAEPGSEGFETPSAAELADWASVLQGLMNGQYISAAALADPLGFDLIEFTDTETGGVYYVLREQTSGGQPLRGQGTYVLNPTPQRELNVQAPHATDDWNTRTISIRMFLDLQARFLEITGASRCASAAASPCDGTTEACGTTQAYRVSDAAHYVNCFFQVTSDEVAAFYPDLLTVNVHGFTPCDPATLTSLVVLSNGTSSFLDDSRATQLAAIYNDLIPASYPGFGAGSCNAATNDFLYRAWPCAEPSPPCGQPNTQGRSINGSSDPCATGVANAPQPERFIHLEQQRVLRESPPGTTHPGVSYQLTIDAFGVFLPAVIWVDFYYAGPETGSFTRPFNSVVEGVAAASPGATVRIKAGVTSQAPTISETVLLTSYGGAAVIGH